MTTTPEERSPEQRTPEVHTPEQRTAEPLMAEPLLAEHAAAPHTTESRTAEPLPADQVAGPLVAEPPAADVRALAPRRPFRAGSAAVAGPLTAGARPPRELPRWVRWTVLPLLVLVPLGYVIISAQQSRESGESKQQEAAARHLTFGYYPSSLQQRIYQVPIPYGAAHVGYLETNSWSTSVLYVQFTTTAGGLDTFLAKAGTSRAALRSGSSEIGSAQARAASWSFAGPGPWAGISMHKNGDKPDHAISVDLHDPDAPTVYVVSTVNFRYGFRDS